MRDAFDEKLAAAICDVPIPEGLAERLLERFNYRKRPMISRPSFIVLCLSLSAGLLLAVWLGFPRRETISQQFVLDEAIRLFDVGMDQPSLLLSDKPPPASFPFSRAVIKVRAMRWRSFEALFGGRGVVYDLPGPTGSRASLFVVQAEMSPDFNTAPTVNPFTTAGCCAAAWREGNLLYVLVVQGDPATYRAYLNLPAGPMA